MNSFGNFTCGISNKVEGDLLKISKSVLYIFGEAQPGVRRRRERRRGEGSGSVSVPGGHGLRHQLRLRSQLVRSQTGQTIRDGRDRHPEDGRLEAEIASGSVHEEEGLAKGSTARGK